MNLAQHRRASQTIARSLRRSGCLNLVPPAPRPPFDDYTVFAFWQGLREVHGGQYEVALDYMPCWRRSHSLQAVVPRGLLHERSHLSEWENRDSKLLSKCSPEQTSPWASSRPGGPHRLTIISSPCTPREKKAKQSNSRRSFHSSTTRLQDLNRKQAFGRFSIFRPSKRSKLLKSLDTWQVRHEADIEQARSESPSWKAVSPSSFRSSVRGTSQAQPSIEYEEKEDSSSSAMQEHDSEEYGAPSEWKLLRAGDLVELATSGASTSGTLAIFICKFSQLAQFYTIHGKCVHRLVKSITYTVPGFSSPLELHDLLPYLPIKEYPDPLTVDGSSIFEMDLPLDPGRKVIHKMQGFLKAADVVYRKNADQLDTIYDRFALQSATKIITVEEAAKAILSGQVVGTLSKPAEYAVHRALRAQNHLINIDGPRHINTGLFEFLPREDAEIVLQVRDWLRDYQNLAATLTLPSHGNDATKSLDATEIGEFIAEARQMILASRQHRQVKPRCDRLGPSAAQIQVRDGVAPPSLPVLAHRNVILGTFKASHSKIIRFMELWVLREFFARGSPMDSVGPTILRAIGLYDGRPFEKDAGYLFLQELGVISPWRPLITSDAHAVLPGTPSMETVNALRKRGIQELRGSPPVDKMAHLRKDWGSLEVFAIDPGATYDVDDGISFEAIEGIEDEGWLHIHVANPTAFLEPSHPLSEAAKTLVDSVYSPSEITSLLPEAFSQGYCSLAPNRPCLTFSGRINLNGELLEICVQPGFVRHVHRVDRKHINHLFQKSAIPERSRTRIFVGNNDIPVVEGQPDGSAIRALVEHKPLLQQLLKFANARRNARFEQGAVDLAILNIQLNCNVKVHYCSPLESTFRDHKRIIEGDPTVVVNATHFDPMHPEPLSSHTVAGSLVLECMLLAGEIAGKWTEQRGIPVIYRGTVPDPDKPSFAEYKKTTLDPIISEHGILPYSTRVATFAHTERSHLKTQPIPHATLGLSVYTKPTSPLRRYSDMVTHWQIEAALRHEAVYPSRTGQKIDEQHLPFSTEEVTALCDHVKSQMVRRNTNLNDLQRHWITYAIDRAHFFQGAQVPKTWMVYIFDISQQLRNGYTKTAMGIIKELSLRCTLQPTSTWPTMPQVGDWWECKLNKTSVVAQAPYMIPLRLVERSI